MNCYKACLGVPESCNSAAYLGILMLLQALAKVGEVESLQQL